MPPLPQSTIIGTLSMSIQNQPTSTVTSLSSPALPCEDVKLKHRDVVVDGEVDGGLQGHGFQGGVDGVVLL